MGAKESSIYIQCKWNWIKNFIRFFMRCQIKELIGELNELKQDEQKHSHIIFWLLVTNIKGIIRTRLYLTSESKRSRNRWALIAFVFEIKYRENILRKWGNTSDNVRGAENHFPKHIFPRYPDCSYGHDTTGVSLP